MLVLFYVTFCVFRDMPPLHQAMFLVLSRLHPRSWEADKRPLFSLWL